MNFAHLVANLITHPANRGHPIEALSRYIGWQLYKRTRNAPRDIPFHGLKLRVYPDSHPTSSALYFQGMADYWEMSFIRKYLRPGDNVLDVGANAGVYSLLAAAYVDNGAIHSFEPLSENIEKLKKQFEINGKGNLHVYPYAVTEREGIVVFNDTGNDATRHISLKGLDPESSQQIACETLDRTVSDISFAFGKMDIEGAEYLALNGALGMLEKSNPPVWLIELAGYSVRFGVRTDEVVEFLKEIGYDCAIYDPDANELVFTDSPWEMHVDNVLAVSRASKDEVFARIA